MIDLEQTRRNVHRFWNLIYAVSVAFSLFTVGLVASVAWGNNPAKAVAVLATVASGGGLAFVIRMKNSAQRTHDEAKASLRRDCSGQRETAAPPRARTGGPRSSFDTGRPTAAPATGGGLPDDAIDILTRG